MRAAPAGGVTERGGSPTRLKSRPRDSAQVYGQNDAPRSRSATPALRHTFVANQAHHATPKLGGWKPAMLGPAPEVRASDLPDAPAERPARDDAPPHPRAARRR